MHYFDTKRYSDVSDNFRDNLYYPSFYTIKLGSLMDMEILASIKNEDFKYKYTKIFRPTTENTKRASNATKGKLTTPKL